MWRRLILQEAGFRPRRERGLGCLPTNIVCPAYSVGPHCLAKGEGGSPPYNVRNQAAALWLPTHPHDPHLSADDRDQDADLKDEELSQMISKGRVKKPKT